MWSARSLLGLSNPRGVRLGVVQDDQVLEGLRRYIPKAKPGPTEGDKLAERWMGWCLGAGQGLYDGLADPLMTDFEVCR